MIRHAKPEDLDGIMKIYQSAREYMARNGNPTQWGDSYPVRELLEADILRKQLYVCEYDGNVHGVFMLMLDPEPTYEVIEGGEWLDEEPYGTIHRVASDGQVKGVFGECVAFCREQIPNLRIDTHPDNHTMQHLIEKYGFKKCGVVYMADKSPRIAYQMQPDA